MSIKGYTFVKDANSNGTPGSVSLTMLVLTDDGVVQTVTADFVTPLTLTAIRTWAFGIAQAHNSQIATVNDVFILNSPA